MLEELKGEYGYQIYKPNSSTSGFVIIIQGCLYHCEL